MTTLGGGSQRLSVLVVEDNADAADSLTLLLRLFGHEAVAARDGRAAEAAALTSPPDVLLMDIGLPGEDGYKVARRLCEVLGRKPLLIAVTGHGREGDRRRSAAEGFDHHLLKPADPAEIRALLRSYADGLGG